MTDLDELERLEKAATAGKWVASRWVVHSRKTDWRKSAPMIADLGNGQHQAEADAALIAAARNALPALVAELRAARETLKRGLHCPECGGVLDNVVVTHRHSTGACQEALIGPDVRIYYDAAVAKKGG